MSWSEYTRGGRRHDRSLKQGVGIASAMLPRFPWMAFYGGLGAVSRKILRAVAKNGGILLANPQCRNVCISHAFFKSQKAGKTSLRKSTARTLKLGRLRARSFWPFLPAPRQTGRDTCRIIRLSGFLVSLTWAYWHGCHHDSVCRAACSCVFGIS